MSTYLFITKPKYEPETVRDGNDAEWSCSSTTRDGDRVLVYVTGVGIRYEWRVTSDAAPDKKWKYVCGVEYVSTFEPPISVAEMRACVPKIDWAPPHTSFRGFRSLLVPGNVEEKIRALRIAAVPSVEVIRENFAKAVAASIRLSPSQRRKRLSSAAKMPTKIEIRTTTFRRNPDVAAEVLLRANGICEKCRAAAPFSRAADGSPYLEIHHVIHLADGGEDTVENAVALCPNCHREAHFGSH